MYTASNLFSIIGDNIHLWIAHQIEKSTRVSTVCRSKNPADVDCAKHPASFRSLAAVHKWHLHPIGAADCWGGHCEEGLAALRCSGRIDFGILESL